MIALSIGDDITAASTITPTHDVHHVIGSTTIDTIVAPSPGFPCMLMLIPDGGTLVLSNAGNVSNNTGSLYGSRPCILVYDPNTSKWYPNLAG